MARDELLAQRDRQIPRCLPDLFDYKTLLYIGMKIRNNYPSFRGQDGFDRAGYQIDVLELSPLTAQRLRRANENGHKFLNTYRPPGMFRTVIEGDVRNAKALTNGKYDVVMWWQGPEHVYPEEIEPTLAILFEKTKKLIVLGCPCSPTTELHPMVKNGQYKGSTSAHFSCIHSSFLEKLGYKTDLVGEPGQKGNNLLAWKRKE